LRVEKGLSMPVRKAAEFVLGSVQLGLPYGVANRTGQPSREVAHRLVRRAVSAGISLVDTARAYGDSEDRLGEALKDKPAVRTFTKLSPLSELGENASRDEILAAVDGSIQQSLTALNKSSLDCLMLHRAQHMITHGGAIWNRLIEKVNDGTLKSLGVSVQNPQEARMALAEERVVHIQLPFNILDWRWREAGVLDAIKARRGLTVHARSLFLQGALLTRDPYLWPKIDGVDAPRHIQTLAGLAEEFGRESVADLCIAYARGQEWLDGVVVGMETEHQLDENLRLFLRRPLTPQEISLIDARTPKLPAQFLDPAQWPKA
jgi:aryl-alcohol dehydrogenase-like predicted oxidoreductase